MSIVEKGLSTILSRTWWALLLRGVIAIVFGVFAFTHPALSLTSLTLIFGIYVLADGIAGAISAITGRKDHEHWIVLLLWSLAGIGIGLVTLFSPEVTTFALLFYIAIWAITTGLLQIVA